MIKPVFPIDETKRLEALKSYAILDTPNQKEYDDITKLAAQICNAPISLISLIDSDRQWFKSNLGLDVSETHRDFSFCAHAINSPSEPFIVEDARVDPRFRYNPLVVFPPNIVFYAGFPLVNNKGYAIGTLCIIDRKPRQLEKEQVSAMQILASTVINLLDLHRKNILLGQELDSKLLFNKTPAMIFAINADDRITNVSDYWLSVMGYTSEDVIGKNSHSFLSKQSDLKYSQEVLHQLHKNGKVSNVELTFIKKNGEPIDILLSSEADFDTYGKIIKSISVCVDVTDRSKIRRALMHNEAKYRQDFTLLKSIFESPQDIIVFALDTNYRYIEFTKYHQITMHMAWGIEIAKGMNMLEVITNEEDRKKAKSSFDRALGGEYFTVEDSYGDENLFRSVYELRYNPIKDEKGSIVGMSAFVIDISARKLSERKNEIFQKALDNSSELLFIITKDAKFYDVSEASCNFLGYSKKELLALSVPDLDPNYTAEVWPKHWQELSEKKSMIFPSQVVTKSGEILDTEVSANYLLYNGVEYNVALTRNITERKKIEREKEYERLEKEAIINSTQDLIWSLDQDYKLIAANKSFIDNIYLYSGILIGKGDSLFFDNYPDELREFWTEKYNAAFNGEVLNFKYFTSKTSTFPDKWMDININPIFINGSISSISCFAKDITESKKSQEEIKKNHEMLEFMDANSSDGFSIFENGKSIYISTSLKKMFELGENEILDFNFLANKIDKEDQQKIHIEVIGAPEKDEINYSYRVNLNNKTKWFEDHLKRYKDENGKLLRTIVNTRNITSWREAEVEREYERIEKEALINSTTDLIFSFDLHFNLLASNQSFLNFVSKLVNREIKKGQSVFPSELPDEVVQTWKANFQKTLNGEIVTSQYSPQNLETEKKIFFEFTSHPIVRNGVIVGAACFGRDITAQIEAQELIRQNNEMLQFMDENSSDGFTIFEGDKVAYMSKSLKKMFNINGENMDMHTLFNFIDAGDRKRIAEDIIQKGRINKVESTSYQYKVNINNELKWLEDNLKRIYDQNGNHQKTIINTRDITDRKLTEFELNQTKELLEETNLVAKIGNWEFNFITKQGKISRIAKSILEVSPDFKPTFLSVFQFFINSRFKHKLFADIKKAMHSDTPFDVELPAITAKNNEIWLRSFGKAQFENGKCIRLYGAIQDITERKREEAELHELLKVTSDQSKRFQNFAYIVSHNIRSHTANFTSLLDMIDRAHSNDEKELFVKLLRPCANNLEETIQNLNEIITIQTNPNLNKISIGLKEAVLKTMQIVGSLIDDTSTKVELDIPENLAIDAIPAYLESILLNLLTNAIKYRKPEVNPIIRLTYTRTNQFIVINFSDNGRGIDIAKYGSKLFGMYKTFHGNPDAKGMGLFLTKEQIEAMGGKIEVDSEVNLGTTFKLYFRI